MKRILKLLLPAILLTAMYSCKPAAIETFGEIYGVVTDMDTAEPVVNAIVVLSPGGISPDKVDIRIFNSAQVYS